MLFYVFVYTIWLKPRSPQNIVIGGAAGAVPVLVGWAAVTGELAAPAWVLFAIVFFWTPPHFWALSLSYFDDYKAAGIPMLPVAKGIPARAAPDRRLLLRRGRDHARPARSSPTTSAWSTSSTAAVLGRRCSSCRRFGWRATPRRRRRSRFFTMSNTYLALLFAAVAVDTLVRSV